MKKLLLLPIVLFSLSAQAAVFSLPQLSTTQTDPLFKNLAADLLYRPVEGATPLNKGKPWGFEVGVTGAVTDASSIASIIGTGTPILPGGSFNIDLGLPQGFGVEFGFIPTLSYSGTSFSSVGGDVRWNFSELFPAFPVDLAARAIVSTASIASTQLLSGANVNINYGTTQFGLMVTAGKTFSVIEPYMSLGLISQSSTLSYSGSTSLFGASFATGTTSVTGAAVSFLFNAGLQFNFKYFIMGGQFDSNGGILSGAAKIGIRI